MPTRKLKPCAMAYCPAMVSRGQSYCERHQRIQNEKSFETKKAHKFYNTRQWRGKNGLRRQHLRTFPFCQECRKENKYTMASVVDHIQPFSKLPEHQAWELFTDPDNLQSLCSHHHAKKTGAGK